MLLINFLALFATVFLNGLSVDCIREQNHETVLNFKKYQKQHLSNIKVIDYIHKNGDGLSITKMPVKNVAINPNNDWQAKAIWIGDNYNQTG